MAGRFMTRFRLVVSREPMMGIADWPKTERPREKLLAHGIVVVPVDVSEVQKAEGAVTCCSLVFTTP